jgi:hypothetical protein
MLDTILVNTPVSSPLHPQLNLPLLKGYLTQNGYKAKVIDSNILFFHHFLGIKGLEMNLNEFFEHPIKLLEVYNDLERQLWEKSKAYDGLHVGLRTLAMKYDRIYFDTVIQSVSDGNANPFISFYDNLIESDMRAQNPKIVGIGITFQDQIIPAFTLASRLRIRLPGVKIVFGGQMITRCYEDMLKHEELCKYFDFLTLWDGEMPFLDIHRKVIRGEEVEFVNAFDVRAGTGRADRLSKAPSSQEVPSPDYTDLPLDAYFVPEYLIPFQTTRGCYAKCAFCAIPFGSNKYRMRTVDRIIEDFIDIQEHTEKKYGKKATYFKFMEDTSSPAILKGISVEIEKRGLDVKWETFARLEKMFAEDGFMEQLYRGGCRKIHWGLESNDPAILGRMKKKNTMSCSDLVLEKSGKAGVLNFCFLLAGFPGESDEARTNLVNYIISNPHIHTLTMTTFDLTRKSPMEQDFTPINIYKLDCEKAKDFQVRLPYTVDGQNWKAVIIPKAHQMMIDIIRGRPDIGFMTLFPDQVRSLLCDHFGNEWGRIFVKKYGEENVKAMLLSTENYAKSYSTNTIIDPTQLPEPLRREHYRTKEDLAMIARAVTLRRDYEDRRFNQV